MQATFHDFFHRCIAAWSSEMCLRKPFTLWWKISPKSPIFQTLRAKRAMHSYQTFSIWKFKWDIFIWFSNMQDCRYTKEWLIVELHISWNFCFSYFCRDKHFLIQSFVVFDPCELFGHEEELLFKLVTLCASMKLALGLAGPFYLDFHGLALINLQVSMAKKLLVKHCLLLASAALTTKKFYCLTVLSVVELLKLLNCDIFLLLLPSLFSFSRTYWFSFSVFWCTHLHF